MLSPTIHSAVGVVAMVSILSWALLDSNQVVVIHAAQQHNQYMNEEVYNTLQMIPVSSSTTTQINYTMWTPKNWTSSTTTSIRRNNNNNNTVPKLQYNAYLLSTTSSQSLRVLVPLMSSKTSTTTTRTASHDVHHQINNNTLHVEMIHYGTPSKPFIRECKKQRLGFIKSHTDMTEYNKNCDYRFFQNTGLLQRTTMQSKYHHCRYAMNGGPFHTNGNPVGIVMIQNGTLISNDFGLNNIGFGIATTKQSIVPNGTTNDTTLTSNYWVMGHIDNITQARNLGVEQFVTGFDWLVYNSSNIAMYRNNTTGARRASRSTIGLTSDGILLLLVTDGCEHCFRHQGMTLTEMADLFIYLGAQYAINMDGGSSSVMVNTSQSILNQPTCYYNAILPRDWLSCERPVSTVICLS